MQKNTLARGYSQLSNLGRAAVWMMVVWCGPAVLGSTQTVQASARELQTSAVSAQQRPAIGIALASRALQPGELVVVTLTFPSEPSDVRVTAFGRQLATFDAGAASRRVLVGIDVEQRPGRYPLSVEARLGGAPVQTTQMLVVHAKQFTTRTLRVSPDFVDPPAALGERIAREAQLVRSAYAQSAPERLWHAPFVRPVSDPASSRFGQRSVFNGKPRNRHNGTDFASPAGTPIKAPNGGRVVIADDLYFSGTTVIIDHGLGLLSMLAHLSQLDVRRGDSVTAGQIVGRVGATGRVTGAHLHWALRVAGARVDPMSALALLGPAAEQPPLAPLFELGPDFPTHQIAQAR
jgi:murein DD-endopeptidase MepM/ murein hydrolase activator NlpD